MSTPLEPDLKFHLSDIHQKDLVVRLPLYGKGYGMEYRIMYAINMIKENHKTSQIPYDHRTAKFATAFDPKSTIPRSEYKKKTDL